MSKTLPFKRCSMISSYSNFNFNSSPNADGHKYSKQQRFTVSVRSASGTNSSYPPVMLGFSYRQTNYRIGQPKYGRGRLTNTLPTPPCAYFRLHDHPHTLQELLQGEWLQGLLHVHGAHQP